MGEAIGLTIKFVNLSFHGKYNREEERVDFSGGQATYNEESNGVDFAAVDSAGVDSAGVDLA